MADTRVCKYCSVEYPIEHFRKSKTCKSGRGFKCGACRNETDKKRREKNIDSYTSYHKEYRERNRERLRQRALADYYSNRETVIERLKEFRAKNRDSVNEKNRNRRRENQELFRTYDRNKRLKRRGAAGSHTARQIDQIKIKQKHRCAICAVKLNKNYHVDHIIPLAKGGTNYHTNLQMLCAPCNQKKHASDPITYMQSLGYLL